jgi:chromosome segregation ATPase
MAITGSGLFPTQSPPATPTSRLGWAGDSIGYIYVYLRGKVHAGERRRRLTEERVGAEAMLSGALTELALAVLKEGVTHPDLTGLLEAIGRAQARRDAAAADMAAADALQQAEATRLGAEETTAEAGFTVADRASREAEEILRATTADRRTAGTRLGRVVDERQRLERALQGEESGPSGAARTADLTHQYEGLASEQRALEEQVARLDRQLTDLRAKAAGLRATAAEAKAKLDHAVAALRQAASAMAASIAGRQRDRGDAEREIADLTAQLGRATAQARPPHTVLLSTYQNIDRLAATIVDRSAQLAVLEQTRGHYDHRKLLTGVGLLTSMLIGAAAALWAVLK